MIILPTLHRPESLRRFVDAYNKTCATLPIHVMLDEGNANAYKEVRLPEHWKRCSVPSGSRLGDIFNMVFRRFPDEEYYGMVADDVVPETMIWDIILRDSCLPGRIAWGWDGIQNERLPVHPFIGGDLVRKLGFWAAPGVKHWFVDNIWKAFADELQCGIYLPQVKMTHYHYVNGMAPVDRTYSSQPNHIEDKLAHEHFMQNEFLSAVERARA